MTRHIQLSNEYFYVLKNLLTLLILSTLAEALSEGMVLTKLLQFSRAPSLSPFATFLGGEAALPFNRGCPCAVEGAENAGAPMSYEADHKSTEDRSIYCLSPCLLQPDLVMQLPLDS